MNALIQGIIHLLKPLFLGILSPPGHCPEAKFANGYIGIRQCCILHAKESSKEENYIDAGSVIYYFAWKKKLMTIPESLKNEDLAYGQKRFTDEKKKKYLEATIQNHSYKTLSDLKFEEKDVVNKYAREYVVNLWLKKADIQNIVDKISYKMIDY
jgi:hypothetical protein